MEEGQAGFGAPGRVLAAAGARLRRPSLPVPLAFAVLIGIGGGSVTGLALIYLLARHPAQSQLLPFLAVLSGTDLILFFAAVLVTRELVRSTYRPMVRTVEALTRMTRERFTESLPPRVPDADSREIVTLLWQFGRTLTAQERQLGIELSRALSDLRVWQHRESQARGLIDLIAEMNQALGLQAVFERLTQGVSRFFAGDGVGIWVRPSLGQDLQLVAQVGETYPSQLTARDHWVPTVLAGAMQPVHLAGSQVSHPSVAVPLADAHGNTIGILVLTPTKRAEYSPQELAFLRSVVGHAAFAIQNALAFDQTDALSRIDSLTGLQNRREFDRVLKHEIDRATRYQRFVSLLMIDIDHFKKINDQRGHPAGDWALQKVAELLRVTKLRGTDSAFRIGGEEFAILLTETDKPGALAMAERLRQTTQALKFFADGGGVTLSMGVATFPLDAREAGELMRQADRALYEAKEAGRNLVIPA